MTDRPLYSVATAYTLSQYRRYNRTIQSEGHTLLRSMVPSIGTCLIGIGASILLETPFLIVLFVGLAVFNAYMTLRSIRAAEVAQYQEEQLVGTITYAFHIDRLEVSMHDGHMSNPYSDILEVLENSTEMYIMYGPRSGMILPKEDCPEELLDFIRSTIPHRLVKDVRV